MDENVIPMRRAPLTLKQISICEIEPNRIAPGVPANAVPRSSAAAGFAGALEDDLRKLHELFRSRIPKVEDAADGE